MKFSRYFTRDFWIIGAVFIVVLLHTMLFYREIGPFNLFTDSGGYLMTADSLFQGKGLVFNPNRPVGLPLLYTGLLQLNGHGLGIIIFFQAVIFLGALFFLVRSVLSGRSLLIQSVVFLSVLLFSTRTFLYSFDILSESLFSSSLFVFFGCFSRYMDWRQSERRQNPRNILLALLVAALAGALIKSVGTLLLLAFGAMFIWHAFSYRFDWKTWVGVVILGVSAIGLNWTTLGTPGFSKQDGIQLLISANEYISYKTDFMTHEKMLIHDSHQEILRRYQPRTRLDQIIGPVEGIETPSQILMKDSQSYDDYNNKIRGLIFEGLASDGNWIKYGMSGFLELGRMVFGDVQEGLIIPRHLASSNGMVLAWLPSIGAMNSPELFSESGFARGYYEWIVWIGVLPKYVALLFFTSALAIAIFFRRLSWGNLLPYLAVSVFLVAYLYVSVLMVFALDRYYAGVETIFFVFGLALLFPRKTDVSEIPNVPITESL